MNESMEEEKENMKSTDLIWTTLSKKREIMRKSRFLIIPLLVVVLWMSAGCGNENSDTEVKNTKWTLVDGRCAGEIKSMEIREKNDAGKYKLFVYRDELAIGSGSLKPMQDNRYELEYYSIDDDEFHTFRATIDKDILTIWRGEQSSSICELKKE